MSRRTSFNACKEAIEQGERLTRQQGRALLDYAEMQSKRAEAGWNRVSRFEHEIERLRTNLEIEAEQFSRLVDRYNAMIHMLHDILGRTLYYDEQITPAEQYRAALIELLGKKGQTS